MTRTSAWRSRVSPTRRKRFSSMTFRSLAWIGASESPILIQGETGTGKGGLAAWLHRHRPRAQEPFVDLNCAGFSRELMDSELFGHEKGAFTGAVTRKAGLLERSEERT